MKTIYDYSLEELITYLTNLDIYPKKNHLQFSKASSTPNDSAARQQEVNEAANNAEKKFANKMKPFKAKQIFKRIYTKNVVAIDQISTLSKPERSLLKEKLSFPKYTYTKQSTSNTIKYLISLEDEQCIECVIIISKKRKTLCISSQVGCKLKCSFCATGTIGFKRNLTAGEIILQYIIALLDNSNKTLPSKNEDTKQILIDNVVFMGMGEPLFNIRNVLKAIDILNDPKGANIGIRKFTISTVGIIPEINKLLESGRRLNLAISLHAATDHLRNTLVPINKKYPVHELIKMGLKYQLITKRRVTLEYILLKDINDKEEDAKNLIKLVNHKGFHINIIPYNPTGLKYSRSTRIKSFMDTLANNGLNITLRKSEGIDISAACGMLVAKK